jgi:uncharacterized protein (TIGR02246 family)
MGGTTDIPGALDLILERVNRRFQHLAHCTALLLAVLLTAVAGCSSTPPGSSPKNGKAGNAQNQEISAEFEQSAAGWNAGNLDAFMAIYADDATFARPDGFVRGKPVIQQLYAPVFAPGVARDSLGMEQLEISPIATDIVLVRGIYRNIHEGRITRRGASTLLMRRINGHWRIIHEHSN